jgi:hypothetical protein
VSDEKRVMLVQARRSLPPAAILRASWLRRQVIGEHSRALLNDLGYAAR